MPVTEAWRRATWDSSITLARSANRRFVRSPTSLSTQVPVASPARATAVTPMPPPSPAATASASDLRARANRASGTAAPTVVRNVMVISSGSAR